MVKEYFENYEAEMASIFGSTLKNNLSKLAKIASLISTCHIEGGTIYWIGNGGSAANAQHMSAELAGRFELERPAISSLALSTDTSLITAISNDYNFDKIFSRQLEAHAERRDVLIAFSTSGESKNIIEAMQVANDLEMSTVSFTGSKESSVVQMSDIAVQIESSRTAIIQDFHQILCHMLCGYLEQDLFGIV